MQEKEDSLKKKKIAVSKLNTNVKTLQMQLENEERKNGECKNEIKLFKRKFEEASNNEKSANSQVNSLKKDLNETKSRLEGMTEQIRTLHEAVRKKDTKLKSLQEKENEISKLKQDAINMERKAKQKFEKAKKLGEKLKQNGNKPSRMNQMNRDRTTLFRRNDPMDKYRKLSFSVSCVFVFFLFVCLFLD